MFSATRVAATIAIFALGASVALISGPLGPSAQPAPGQLAAETPSPGVIVSGASTRISLEYYGDEVIEDGIPRLQGNRTVSTPEMDDPRVIGTYRLTQSGQNRGGLGPMWGTMRVENEAGAWEGLVSGYWTDNDTRFGGCLTGEAAYEGFTYCLQAAADVVLSDVTFNGVIYEGDLPPVE